MDFLGRYSASQSTTRRQFVAGTVGAWAGTSSAIRGSLARADQLVANCRHGNRARMLTDDSTSLLHRLQLIESAEREVLMSVYEVGDDAVALRVLAALREAARRGVEVKLMVDGHGTNNLMPKPMMAHLLAESVAIQEHLPDVRYQLELGRQRMHDKLMIVDGQRLIIGGRNLRSDYYGMGCGHYSKNRWDLDAYITGPIVGEARGYYLSRWSAATSGQPTLDREEKRKTVEAQQLGALNDVPRPQAIRCAAQLLDEARVAPLPYSSSCCQQHGPDCACQPLFDLNCVRFLHDTPERSKDCPEAIAAQLNSAIAAAKQSLLIATPYLVISRQLRDILKSIRQQGVDVYLLTNSLASTDRTITHAQYANERRWMIRAGIELWEVQGERMLHAKAMVIDGRYAMIGSYNFDVLSETRNSETAILSDDVPFAEEVTRQVAEDLKRALPVDEPLIGFDARRNDVDQQTLRKLRTQRFISPWIKRYL